MADSLEPMSLQSLHTKIDSLSKAVKNISIKVHKKKYQICELGPLLAVGQKNFEDALAVINQWSNIKNIGEIKTFPDAETFPKHLRRPNCCVALRCLLQVLNKRSIF